MDDGRCPYRAEAKPVLPLDDWAFFLEDNTPPRSALTQGSVGDDGSRRRRQHHVHPGAVAETTHRMLWRADGMRRASHHLSRLASSQGIDLFSTHMSLRKARPAQGRQVQTAYRGRQRRSTTVVKCCLAKRVRDA
jgi:hypothetical protein